jgi:hypothetical protein
MPPVLHGFYHAVITETEEVTARGFMESAWSNRF